MTNSSARKSKANTKINGKTLSRFMMTSALVAVGSFGSLSIASAADYTLPTGGTVLPGNGSASIAPSGIDKLNINQETDRVIINWNTFNIGADATVQFYQPNSGSLAVNRVSDSVTFTSINGKLLANGKIVILDPNGVIFGAGSVTDVGSIVASTGNINDSAFMAGGKMQLINFGTGEVVNNGFIKATGGANDYGLVALVAPTVKNNGVITAKLGRVSLAAGDVATVDFYGDGLVELGLTGNKSAKFLSENTGTIKAVGGKIQMTAASARNVVDSVVNMQGVLRANSAKVKANGQIVLSADKVIVGGAKKEVKIASKVKSPAVTGDTNITAKSVDLGLTINGQVTGSAKEVNVLSDAAKISQGLDIVDTFGTVNVDNGTYNEHLVVSKKGVTLKSVNGASKTTVIPNSPGVTIVADNVTVDGFTFTGATGLDGYGIFVNGGNQATIKNNVITNNSQEGIYIINSWKTLIDRNVITDTGSHGIYANNSNSLSIRNNEIGVKKGGIHNINGDGILLDNSQSASIFNNNITHTTSTSTDIGSGIQLRGSGNANLDFNRIFGTDWDGIRISKSNNVTAVNNKIDNVKRVGIFTKQSRDLTVINNDIYGALLRGIVVDRMTGASLIKANKIDQIGVDGIVVNLSNDTVVQGNIIGYGNDVAFNTKDDSKILGHGIRVTDSNNVDIIENKIAHTGLSGIYAINSQNIEIGTAPTRNMINFTGSHGIQVINSNGAKIIGNEVGVMKAGKNNINGDGIFVDNSDNATINVNIISKTTSTSTDVGSGIHVKNSDNASLFKNAAFEIAWDGIKITGGDTISLRNNVITDVERTGIFAKNGGFFTATNNSVYDAGRDGLGMWDMYGSNNISSNKINKIGIDGIKILRSNNTTVASNFIGYGDNAIVDGDDTNIGRDGVRVEGSSNVSVNNNKIANAAQNGVHAIDVSGLVTINGNTIDNSGVNGIYVQNYNGSSYILASAKIMEDINPSALDGLYINDKNDISNSGANGIYVNGATGYVEIKSNVIDNSGENGVYVANYSPSYYFYPLFAKTDESSDMVVVERRDGLFINLNNISNSGTTPVMEYSRSFASGNGIQVTNANGYVEIADNDVSDSGLNGIYVSGYNRKFIPMMETQFDMIRPYPGRVNIDLLVSGNFVTDSGSNGVYLSGLNGNITVSKKNEIYNSENNGVLVEGVNQYYGDMYYPDEVSFLEEAEQPAIYPIYMNGRLVITGNDIDNSGYNGISINQTGGYVSVDNNIITDSGSNGLYVYNSSDSYDGFDNVKSAEFKTLDYSYYSNPIELHIVDNTIENIGFVPNQGQESSEVSEEAPNGFAAINLNISADGTAKISGNTLGNNFEYGLFAQSGEIDLTGAANTIQNTDIGMGFYPVYKNSTPETDTPEYFSFLANKLRLVNDTIGTTKFIDQADLFIDLGYGAFYAPGTPTILNGNDATYTLGGATISPSVNGGVTQAEYDVLEARINHFNDFQNRGLFFFNILDPQTIDQKDTFRLFSFSNELGEAGSLTVTGLPSIGGANRNAPPAGAFDPNAIEPAAGDEETTANDAASIQPAANGETSSCWSDATQSLGQGSAVTINFGESSSSLLQDAASCGNGQGQSL